MSVIYNGKEYRVKNKQGFLMLNLSRKKIKKISDPEINSDRINGYLKRQSLFIKLYLKEINKDHG